MSLINRLWPELRPSSHFAFGESGRTGTINFIAQKKKKWGKKNVRNNVRQKKGREKEKS